ncbi:hypothetical protein ACFE04_025790 [Oxalis oulophora]
MGSKRLLSHFVLHHDLLAGTMTLPAVWATHCKAFMADQLLLTTVDGKQWEVAVTFNCHGNIVLSGQALMNFITQYDLYVSDEVEFEPAYGRNLFVRVRNYNGIEIDYGSEEHKKEMEPNDNNGSVPTLCLLLWEEGLDEMLLPIPPSWPKHYPTFLAGSELELELKIFIDHYKIRSGYRLMFEYLDEALFRVVILDADGVEIRYPKVRSVGINIEEIAIPTNEGTSFEEFSIGVMNILTFYVIVLNSIVEEGRLPLPRSFPDWLSDKLGAYLTIRSRSGMCWTVTVEKSSDGRIYLGGPGWAEFAGHHSLSFGHFLLFHCKRAHYFKVNIFDRTATEIDYPAPEYNSQSSNDRSKFCKRMTPSDITGRQTIGIPLRFIRENWYWFHCCHEKCYMVVHGERSEKSRISWNFREGRWEGALCSRGWRFALNKLSPSQGDVLEFKLVFDVEDKVHHFNVRISESRA